MLTFEPIRLVTMFVGFGFVLFLGGFFLGYYEAVREGKGKHD